MPGSDVEERESSEPLKARLRPVLIPFALSTTVVCTAFRLFLLICRDAANVMYWDQFDYMRLFFTPNPSWASLFLLQHGPPRLGLGLIVDKYLYAWTHWNTRAESFFIFGCICCALFVALLLRKKLFGRLSFSDIAIPMMFMTLTQFETFVGTPNASYSGIPLLLIMLFCLALLRRGYLVKYGLLLILNFFITFTGFGVFMGPVTIGIFALECYWWLRGARAVPLWASAGALVIASATLARFFENYTFEPSVDCFVFPYQDLKAYPWFVALMIARYLGVLTNLTVAAMIGLAVVAGVVAISGVLGWRVVRGTRFEPRELVVAAMLGFTTLFCINTAVGRVCLGVEAAVASRYATLLIPGALAVYFWVQSIRSDSLRKGLIAAFIIALIPGCLVIPPDAAAIALGKRAWASCYILTGQIAQCDETADYQIYPYPERTHLKEKLEYLREHHLNFFAD